MYYPTMKQIISFIIKILSNKCNEIHFKKLLLWKMQNTVGEN